MDLYTEKNIDLSKLSKADLKDLIAQLELGMKVIITSGDKVKINSLNELIGKVIDLYISK